MYIIVWVILMKKIILVAIFLILINTNVYALDLSAQYCCMIESDTKKVVYEKNAYSSHSMASTTKIMTAIVALEKGTQNDVVTVSFNASRQEGSSLYLKPNDKIKMLDLLYGLMLNSGNDAAVAVAEHISGRVEAFADEMNKKAAEIGAMNTSFKNPNGLDDDGHFSTAYDMALIGNYAMRNEDFRRIVATKNVSAQLVDSGTRLYFSNHNKLLKQCEYVTGIKTGYTKATGRCLVSSADIDGMKFVICTLNAPDDWNDHKKLYEYAKSEYERRVVIKKGQFLKTGYVGDSALDICSGDDIVLTLRKNKRFDGEVQVNLYEDLTLPISEGNKMGECRLMENGEVIAEFDAVSMTNVAVPYMPKKSWWKKLISWIK